VTGRESLVKWANGAAGRLRRLCGAEEVDREGLHAVGKSIGVGAQCAAIAAKLVVWQAAGQDHTRLRARSELRRRRASRRLKSSRLRVATSAPARLRNAAVRRHPLSAPTSCALRRPAHTGRGRFRRPWARCPRPGRTSRVRCRTHERVRLPDLFGGPVRFLRAGAGRSRPDRPRVCQCGPELWLSQPVVCGTQATRVAVDVAQRSNDLVHRQASACQSSDTSSRAIAEDNARNAAHLESFVEQLIHNGRHVSAGSSG